MEINFLKPENFYFKLPLYTPIQVNDTNRNDFINLVTYNGKIEGFNPFIKENSTFKVVSNIGNSNQYFFSHGGREKLSIRCGRNEDTFDFYILFNRSKGELMKFGQYPSIADFHISQIKKYKNLLSDEYLKEFTRAIGLAANGVGVGSFIYLRRIFENLIEEAHQLAKNNDDWVEEKYNTVRLADKIERLKNFLPSFLYDNRVMYGILSKGVHSLTERECLLHFESVKMGIELILDEKLEEANKNAKIEEAKKKLAQLSGQINSQNK